MRFYKIKNWAEFQHYKDRNPPWIKLHRALLDDVRFMRLTDLQRGHLMMIWIVASQNGGTIPDDPKFVQARIGASRPVDLKVFEDAGFLLPDHDASDTLAPRKQDASTMLATRLQLATVNPRLEEERREEEIRAASAASPPRKKSRLPDDFAISDRVRAWAIAKSHDRLEARFEHFVSYAKRNGAKYVDWDEAFMAAIRENWAKLPPLPAEEERRWQ